MSGLVPRDSVNVVSEGYVVAHIGDQLFGIPTLSIQDVVRLTAITHVPRAAPYVRGIANMRGRVVTVIDTATFLNLDSDNPDHCVTVNWKGALCGLLVEEVDRVINVSPGECVPVPFTVPLALRQVSKAVIKEEDHLIILLDIQSVLTAIDGKEDDFELLE